MGKTYQCAYETETKVAPLQILSGMSYLGLCCAARFACLRPVAPVAHWHLAGFVIALCVLCALSYWVFGCGDFDLIEHFVHLLCPFLRSFEYPRRAGIEIEICMFVCNGMMEEQQPAPSPQSQPGFKDNLWVPGTALNAANLFLLLRGWPTELADCLAG